MEDIDRLAQQLKKEILESTSDIKVSGTVYYVAADGNDDADGLTPETAMRTLDKVSAMDLKPGDAVLFRRGDLWRGTVQTRRGVTYAAYGKGQKPRLYASPCNAAQEGTWTETDVPGVYVYDLRMPNDVGVLVFDEGEKGCAFKVMKVRQPDSTTTHVETGEPFADYRHLKRDLDFYHDYSGTQLVYLCSQKGHPAERFRSIEMNVKTNLMRAVTDVTIDNLCLKYCGAHAVGAGTVDSLRVTNCEIGWVGGSIQGEDIFGRNLPTRFGNGVEIYGGCKKFVVDHCYIYQIYDAAITHQHLGDGENPLTMENVTYTNNLVEDCVYAFEYFLGKASNDTTRLMRNVLIADNVARRTGMGWGAQRPDKETPAAVKSWVNYNRAEDFRICNNVFDRSTRDLLNISAQEAAWLPTLQNNVYVQYRDGVGGKIGSRNTNTGLEKDPFWNNIRNDEMRYPYDENFPELLKRLFHEENGKFITVDAE